MSDPGGPPRRTTRARLAATRSRAAGLQHRAGECFVQERTRRGWVQDGWYAWLADRNRGGGLLAGGLAYRIFLWQLPAALLVVSITGIVASLASRTPDDLARSAGVNAAVAGVVSSATTQAGEGKWALLLIGLWGTWWAGRGAARAVRLVAEIAWQARAERRWSSARASLGFTGIMGGAIALQTVVSQWLDGGFVQDVTVWGLLTLALGVYAAWAFTLLPRGGRHWTAVLPGAFLFLVMLRLVSLGSTIYLSGKIERVNDLYGGLGIAIVILLFLYVEARLFVGAMFLNATIAGVAHGTLAESGLVEGGADRGSVDSGA